MLGDSQVSGDTGVVGVLLVVEARDDSGITSDDYGSAAMMNMMGCIRYFSGLCNIWILGVLFLFICLWFQLDRRYPFVPETKSYSFGWYRLYLYCKKWHGGFAICLGWCMFIS